VVVVLTALVVVVLLGLSFSGRKHAGEHRRHDCDHLAVR
jgi:hypothetical protein